MAMSFDDVYGTGVSCINNGGWTKLLNHAQNVDYVCELDIVDTTHYNVIVNGTTYNNSGNHYLTYNNQAMTHIGKIQSFSWEDQTYTLDDISCSWITATTAYPMTTYIDNISGSWIGGTLKRWDGASWLTCNLKVRGV
jgi:hypothetical protein